MTSAKNWMVSHIRRLFENRPERLSADVWTCVIRDGELVVVHRFGVRSGDHEVMRCFLSPGQIPSWFGTSNAVQQHWPILEQYAMSVVAERKDHMFPQPWANTCAAPGWARDVRDSHENLVGS